MENHTLAKTGLSLCLSSKQGTLALYQRQGGKVHLIKELVTTEEGNHCETMVGSFQKLRALYPDKWEQLDEFIAPFGPGSFTGLRIGMVALKAMAQHRALPLYSVSSAEARAASYFLHHLAHKPHPHKPMWVSTKIARDRFHFQKFTPQKTLTGWTLTSGQAQLLEPPHPCQKTQLLLLHDGELPLSVTSPQAVLWQTQASHLGCVLEVEGNFEKAATPKEIGWMSPHYFGDKPLKPSAINPNPNA